MSDAREKAVAILAAELELWSGGEGELGWVKGNVPTDDDEPSDPYPTIDEYEARHGVRCPDGVRAQYVAEREAWLAHARRVLPELLAELGAVVVDPALVDAVEKADAYHREMCRAYEQGAQTEEQEAAQKLDAELARMNATQRRVKLADAVLAQLRAKP